ncbi:MAG: hypothetical protein M3Z92_03735 [Bacteroidota bacterium]|nr:hypothetical protein [Bacteroidota bacterium]
MQKIIASYLAQKKECGLPGIGHFKIIAKPAELDVASKLLLPPTDEIIFSEEEVHLRKDLVTYLSSQKQMDMDHAAEYINNWCGDARGKLEQGEKIFFESIGSLQRSASGNFYLERDHEFLLYDPVPAERVIHKHEEHSVLVGDKETTSHAMNEYFKDDPVIKKKAWWKIWAIVMVSVSLLILIIHFSTHSFSTGGLGNQIHLSPDAPAASYELK